MSTTLSGFFKENTRKKENIKSVISDRFTDPNTGEPYEWELRPLGAKEDEMIRAECIVRTRDRKGRIKEEIDKNRYVSRAMARSVVFPNLMDAELQDNWGVRGEEELLSAMLLSAENTKLLLLFNELNGYDNTMEDLVDEAKN